MKALIVERADGIAHDLIRKFEDSFSYKAIGLGQFRAGIVAGHAQSGLRLEIQNDAALDVPGKRHHAGHTFAAISILFHREVAYFGRTRKALRQHGIGRVDERLNQLHLHVIRPPRPPQWPRRRLPPSHT